MISARPVIKYSKIKDLVEEKNISKDVVFEAMELALLSAYKKNFNSRTNAKVNINRETGEKDPRVTIVEHYVESGMTKVAFCKEYNIEAHLQKFRSF